MENFIFLIAGAGIAVLPQIYIEWRRSKREDKLRIILERKRCYEQIIMLIMELSDRKDKYVKTENLIDGKYKLLVMSINIYASKKVALLFFDMIDYIKLGGGIWDKTNILVNLIRIEMGNESL